jgi:hypothetical protein
VSLKIAPLKQNSNLSVIGCVISSLYTKDKSYFGGSDMAQQIRSFVLHLAANVNLYQLTALGLALAVAAIPLGMPGGGGGGVG